MVDNTNPTCADRQRYINAAKAAGYALIGYYFQSKVEDCLRRNSERPGSERVPDVAILSTAKKLEPPNWEEGFDRLFHVRLVERTDSSLRSGAMKFDDLDRKNAIFETAADDCVPPGMFMVARLDGRSFTRLTKETHDFEVPFDERFRDLMVETSESLMNCGFRVIYACAVSDEISLLFDPGRATFWAEAALSTTPRSLEKRVRNSRCCSAVWRHSTAESRRCQTPIWLSTTFAGGNEDAAAETHLVPYCYWTYRKQGLDVRGSNERNCSARPNQPEERFSIWTRDQLQRSSVLAEARQRVVLGSVRETV